MQVDQFLKKNCIYFFFFLNALAGVTQWGERWPANWKVASLVLVGTGAWVAGRGVMGE